MFDISPFMCLCLVSLTLSSYGRIDKNRHRLTGSGQNCQAIAVQVVAESDKQQFLAIHNSYRKELSIGPLVWDDNLAQSASAWGAQLAQENKFYHSHTPDKGENLYWGNSNYGKVYTLMEAANAWGGEKSLMKGRKFDPHCGAGHYTQMIWRDTCKVGAAVVKRDNDFYIVAHYYPAGNWIGENVY